MDKAIDGLCGTTRLTADMHIFIQKTKFIHLKYRILYVLKLVLIPTDWGSEKMLCIWPDQNRQLNQIHETNGSQVAEDREGKPCH